MQPLADFSQLLEYLYELKARRLAAANIINPRLQAGFRRRKARLFVEDLRRRMTAAALLVQRVFRGHRAREWWAVRLALMIKSAK